MPPGDQGEDALFALIKLDLSSADVSQSEQFTYHNHASCWNSGFDTCHDWKKYGLVCFILLMLFWMITLTGGCQMVSE